MNDLGGLNLPPFIDKTHVSPLPSEALRPIKIGQSCRKDFIIPPIKDPNQNDQLYYLWFIKKPNDLYGKLLQPGQGIVRADDRQNAVISLTLDKQTIERALGEKIDVNFFLGQYLIEFYVADRQYLIPENRYIDSNAHEDYMHWTVSFADNEC